MDEHQNLVPLNLQFFADPEPVDMGRIVDNKAVNDPKELFALMIEADEDVGDDGGDPPVGDPDVYVPDSPILFPRLAVTDQNLLHTAVGKTVVRNEEGELYTVTVEEDGTVTDNALQIGADNIEDGCISGSKLEESTITTRELDMAEIFADVELLNQTLVENLDTEVLFNNDGFMARLDERMNERVADKAVLKEGDTMTGPLLLSGKPEQELGAATKQYVDTAVSGEMPGNAATAAALKNAKTISIGGKVTGTATAFDGRRDITIDTTAVDATTFCGKDLSYFQTQGTAQAGTTTSVNGVEQVNGNVQLTGADIEAGPGVGMSVQEWLGASKKTHISYDPMGLEQPRIPCEIGDRQYIPYVKIHNHASSTRFTSANIESSNCATGVSYALADTKIKFSEKNTSAHSEFRFSNVYLKPMTIAIVKEHIYFFACLSTCYRTASSGTFSSGCSTNFTITNLAGIYGRFYNELGDIPPVEADAKTSVFNFYLTATRSGEAKISVGIQSNGASSIGTTTAGTVSYEIGDMLCIDLTECFGAGNEPSQSTCESMFLPKRGLSQYPYTANKRIYFEDMPLGDQYKVCNAISSEGLPSWSSISILSDPRTTYPAAAAGFSFKTGYPQHRRMGQLVYFEIKLTIDAATTAGEVKTLATNAFLPCPKLDSLKFPCYSSVQTDQIFLQMTKTYDGIVQLSLQTIVASAAGTSVTVTGMYLAENFDMLPSS